MKGVVNKRLNKRVQGASVNAEKLNPYEVGDVVEIVEILNGDDIDGNNVWYRLDDGTYVWSGGIAGNSAMPKENVMIGRINTDAIQWWHKDYGLPEIWEKGYRGQGVKVAIIDSGINKNHIEFTQDLRSFKPDYNGHGTNCASVVCAAGVDKTVGVAPDSELFIDQIYLSPGDGFYADELSAAITRAADAGVNVISLSLGGTEDEKEKRLIETAIDYAIKKEIIVLASIGNNPNSTKGNFPATYKNCISVGSVGRKKSLSTFTTNDPSLDICAPGEEMLLADITPGTANEPVKDASYKTTKGTSFSTPFVAGVIALMISSKKFSFNKLKSTIIDTADLNNQNVKVINPTKIFK